MSTPHVELHAHITAAGGASVTNGDGCAALAVKATLIDREVKGVRDPAWWIDKQVREYRDTNPDHAVQVRRWCGGQEVAP